MGRDDVLAILRDFKQRFAEKYGILEIGIFGSTARDDAREDSDVDICIKTKTLIHLPLSISRKRLKAGYGNMLI